MTTRGLGPGAGLDWIKRAINLGAGNPRAIFGGAALFIVAIMAAAIVLTLLTGLLATTVATAGAASMAVSLLLTLPLLLVAACLMVGYLRLVHAVESGRAASPLDAFSGFSDMQTSLRAFALVLVLAVLQNAVLAGFVTLFSPGLAEWYMEVMQMQAAGQAPDPATMVLPDGAGMVMLLVTLLALLVYAVQAIGLGQLALGGRSVGGALSDGFSGTFRNVLPLLVLVLLGIAAAVVAFLGLLLVALVIGLLAKLLGGWIAILLAVPLYIAIVLALVVVSFGVMYHLWRDVTGGAVAAPGVPADSVEL